MMRLGNQRGKTEAPKRFKFAYRQTPGHRTYTVYVGAAVGQMGKAGELTMRHEEAEQFEKLLSMGAAQAGNVVEVENRGW